MPEVQIERESFLQVAVWLDEKEQVTFPVFGDLLVALIGIEFFLKALKPLFTWEYGSHENSLLNSDEFSTVLYHFKLFEKSEW
jgi:hypothetical protein